MSSRPATIPEIVDAVQRTLRAQGALGFNELLVALVADGVEFGLDPDGTLDDVLMSDDAGLVMPLGDGRWAYLPSLLSGRVFTHRLTASEIEHDVIAISPDLEPISLMTEDEQFQQLVDGAAIHEVFVEFDDELLGERGIPPEAVPDDGAWLLPARRLAQLGARPGQLLALRPTAGGFALELHDDSALAESEHSDRVAAMLEAATLGDHPHEISTLFWGACAADANLLRGPARPLGELFDELGLVHAGHQIAPPGFDFDEWSVGRRTRLIGDRHHLTDDEALAVILLTTIFEQSATLLAAADVDVDVDDDKTGATDSHAGDDGDAQTEIDLDGDHEREVVVETMRFLESPDVAKALLFETLGSGAGLAPALGFFADFLQPSAPPQAQAALFWMRAKACARLGIIGEAEADLRTSLEHDPDWTPALCDLATYASERGDADGGLALLRRAGAPPDDPLLGMLQAFRPRARRDLGRNDRCWCGSGRKYKQCHLGNETLPIEERASWLYQKAAMYLQDGPFRREILDIADVRSQHSNSETALLDALDDPLVGDAMLFEHGVFARFLAERGRLLPDDERLLGEQWLLVARSLFEVETTSPGEGISVRDIRTGDRLIVRERTGSRHMRRGDLICARIVPAGDTTQIFGGIEPVGLHKRDALIALLDDEPDAVELVEFLSARFAPPTLQNTEGDPFVVCETSIRVPNPDLLAGAFDDRFDRRDNEPRDDGTPERIWIESVTTHGMDRVRATLRLAGDVLHIDANSEERTDRLLASIRSLQPDAVILDDRRTPADDLHEAMSRAPGRSDRRDQLDADDPEIAALLDASVRAYEDVWLDESIPALDGLSPRQAAADPTRRDDLVRLLDSFDLPPGAGVMDMRRLRAALGL